MYTHCEIRVVLKGVSAKIMQCFTLITDSYDSLLGCVQSEAILYHILLSVVVDASFQACPFHNKLALLKKNILSFVHYLAKMIFGLLIH